MSTSGAGSIRVEVQSEEGTSIEGFALDHCHEAIGDEIARTISWEGGSDLSDLTGVPVRLRFELKDADLYALQFID
jgi:hypothetical protein